MASSKKYMAYMLRIWWVNNPGANGWQASLEDPHNGKQIGFADLASLFSYLKDQACKDLGNDEISTEEQA